MGRGKGAESGRVQAGNTAPWARSSLLRGTHPTAGAAQETQPAVGPHTVQFFDEQAVGTESARVDLPVIAYCSGECQRGHWKLHKTVCKETTKRLQTVTELMVAHCHNCKSPHVPTKQCNVCLHSKCPRQRCFACTASSIGADSPARQYTVPLRQTWGKCFLLACCFSCSLVACHRACCRRCLRVLGFRHFAWVCASTALNCCIASATTNYKDTTTT